MLFRKKNQERNLTLKSPVVDLIHSKRGFTLIELMVSVSLFAIIMTISMGSILSVFDANKKSESLRTVLDNLNFTLEAMTRTIRFGTNYHCNADVGTQSATRDCAISDSVTLGGATTQYVSSSFAVTSADGVLVVYRLTNDGRITRTIGATPYKLTSPDVTITDLSFRVIGTDKYSVNADILQPQVIINIAGIAGSAAKPSSQSTFTLQTTVSQRLFDSQ